MCLIRTDIVIAFALLIASVSANSYCYSSGGLFGIIIASVFVTVVVISVTFALIYYLWITKRLKLDFILNKTKRRQEAVNSTKKDVESVNHEYAFDNPYFKEDDEVERGANFRVASDAQITKEENKISAEDNKLPEVNKETNFKVKLRNGVLSNKDRFVKSLPPLSSVFNNVTLLSRIKHKNDGQMSKDDSYLTLKPERVEVELIGHDFTGLGFSICGNMRTGIFIKEVQNRGPANECGKIKTGDRIVSVKVSYERMVYEDAIAILSYASPYNVCLELEKLTNYGTIDKISNSKQLSNRNNGISSYSASKHKQQLLHPLYRSNSFNNLSRIEKDVSLSEKSSISSSKNIFVQKIKSQIFSNKRESDKQSEAANASSIIDEITQKNLTAKENAEKSEDISDGQVSAVSESDTSDRLDSTAIVTLEPSIMINNKPTTEVDATELPKSEPIVVKEEENQLPVVKVVPAKRKGKAPQPPIVKQEIQVNSSQTPSNYETIETKAQVHNVDNNIEKEVQRSDETFTTDDKMISDLNGHISSSSSSSSESLSVDTTAEQNKSLLTVINAVSEQSTQSNKRVQSPTGKLKSHSLSDLTVNSNNCDKLQSALLERAVSLDMNAENLPEENLYQQHQGRNLLLATTDHDETDSMPVLNWYNKQTCVINSDSNSSSVSTLNETDQISAENETSVNGFEQSLNSGDIFKFDAQPHSASTPLKLSNSAIDQCISFDVSSLEKADTTLTDNDNNDNIDSPDLPQLIENRSKFDDKNREVIEISRAELDTVMMSHKTFLEKSAKLAATPQMFISPVTIINNEIEPESAAALDYESWSYISGEFNANNNNPIKSDNESTLYTTALDNSTLNKNSQDSTIERRKLPEIAGITLKTSENGQLNTSLLADNDQSTNSSLG